MPIGSDFVFGPLCKHHLHVQNTLKLAQLSNNTQFVALMHIITNSKSISSKNITYETPIYLHEGAAGARNVLEFRLGVKIWPPRLNNRSTGTLDGSAVLYYKYSFCVTGYLLRQ